VQSGEENLLGLASLQSILKILKGIGMQKVEESERYLTRYLIEGMKAISGVHILGIQEPGTAQFEHRGGVVAFFIEGIPHNVLAARLAEVGGIGIRDGCFCAHIFVKRLMHIHPLREAVAGAGFLLGVKGTKDILPGLARVSLGLENTEDDIGHFLETLRKIVDEPRSKLEKRAARTMNACPYHARPEMHDRLEEFSQSILKQVYVEM
jgi:selenocysteine lyase/cysteine desulfurase